MIDVPANALEKSLSAAFRDHVGARFDRPWAATASVLEYLQLGVMSVYVRGEAAGENAPEWYVQITFSGCAGMAEVSSELAAHWAERWYRAEQANVVSTHLRPYGFEPNGRIEPDRSAEVFAPIGTAGYAVYNATPREEEEEEDGEGETDEEDFESRYFDIDASALEMLSKSERLRALKELDEGLPRFLPAGSCCCQWCAPAFDVAAADRVVPFR